MTTQTPNTRGGIPTVSDLLENPSVRTLVDRWNRSVVVSGVRSFLDELRVDLTRRGETAGWPSLREIAERAARHVTALQQPSRRPVINATGQIWGQPWVGRPQRDVALERALIAGREFIAASNEPREAPTAGDVESLVCRLTGAAASVAVHSYSGALWLALSTVAAGREVVVGRGELGDVESGCSLVELIKSARAVLREVGAANGSVAEDYESAVNPQTAALLKICQSAFCVIGITRSTEIDQLVPLARDRELVLIDAVGTAPLVDLSPETPFAGRSARASLAAGANLVVARGDGLAGGPPCGILAGDAHIVRQIVEHPMFAAWELDPSRTAALAASLHCDLIPSRGEAVATGRELLTTPLDNLRNRAERLAQQLAAANGIGSAEAVAVQSFWDGLPAPGHALESYGVALTAADGDASAIFHRLESAPLPVIGRIEGNRVLLDLRTVFPRHDPAIVRALIGEPAEAAATEVVTT